MRLRRPTTFASWSLEYYRAVRRTHHPDLYKFALLASVRSLPVESSWLTRGQSSRGWVRGEGCKLCGAPAETVEHALCECPAASVAPVRAQAIWQGVRAFDAVPPARRAQMPMGPPAVGGSQARARGLGPAIRVPAFFDPSGRATLVLCTWLSQEAPQEMREYDPLAGFLGILPGCIDEALSWVQWAPGRWRRLPLGQVQKRVEAFQAALLWGGLRVWQARCRAMDAWFASPEAELSRAGYVRAACGQARARAMAAEARGRQGAVGHPPPRANPRPQRSEAARSRQFAGPDAFCVRFGADVDAAEDETYERLADLTRCGGLSLPWF